MTFSRARAHTPHTPRVRPRASAGAGENVHARAKDGFQIVRLDCLRSSRPMTKLFRKSRAVGLRDERGRYDYYVPLNRCQTSGELLAWILHLAEKNWITKRHLMELIEHAERENGIEVHRGM